MTTRTVKPARFVPWDAMTDAQRGEHIRVMHGWDVTGEPGLLHALDHDLRGSAQHVPHTHDKDDPR